MFLILQELAPFFIYAPKFFVKISSPKALIPAFFIKILAWLNTMAEKENVNFSQILQKALKDYLKVDKKNLHDINI